jgi:hypothetical protein
MDNGKYRAVVTSHALAKSSNTGTPSIKVTFLTKYNVENPSIPIQKTMYGDLWLTDATIERTMHTLTKTFAWKGNRLKQLNDNPSLLAGAECVLVVENENYNGNDIPKVKFVNDLQKRLEDDEAEEIDNMLEAKLAAYKNKSPKVGNNPAPQDAPPPITDDDMPF